MAVNGEIPNVPIITLAGISSLTDLLPEMPLPSPLPHTYGNKSLLFHPRVAEEAHNLLKLRDENLVPLLANSLSQTSSDHIELKDHYAGTDQLSEQQFQPELLKAIIQKNPTVFKSANSQKIAWQMQRQTQQQQLLFQQLQKQSMQQSMQFFQVQAQRFQFPRYPLQMTNQKMQPGTSQEAQSNQQIGSPQFLNHHVQQQKMQLQAHIHQQQQQQQQMLQHQQMQQQHIQQQMQQQLQQMQQMHQYHSQAHHVQQQQQSPQQITQQSPHMQSPQQIPQQSPHMQRSPQQISQQSPHMQQSPQLQLSPQMQQSPQMLQTSQPNQSPHIQQSSQHIHQNQQHVPQSQHIQTVQLSQLSPHLQRAQIITQNQHGQSQHIQQSPHIQAHVSQQSQTNQQQHQTNQIQHQSVITVGPSMSSNLPSMSSNFGNKMPSSPATTSNYGVSGPIPSVEYANSMNSFPSPGMPMRMMESNRIVHTSTQNYTNSVDTGNAYQSNYPSTSHASSPMMHHGVAGSSKSHAYNMDGASSSSAENFHYHPVIQNPAMMPSLPTPAPTPSPTPMQSPTRFVQRPSVITSDAMQQNGMFSLPMVEKFLVDENINLNLNDPSLGVPDMMDQFTDQDGNIIKMQDIIDPNTNEPIRLPPQIQSELESHLRMNTNSSHMSVNAQHEVYPADMLESTINSNEAESLLNEVSGEMSLISGALSITPPPSSSVTQIEAVSNIPGMSPQENYELPENVTPLLNDKEQEVLFNKLRDTKKEPVIRLTRLNDEYIKSQPYDDVANAHPEATQNDISKSSCTAAKDETKNKSNHCLRARSKQTPEIVKVEPETLSTDRTRRKRNSKISENAVEVKEEEEEYVPRPKLKKIERKLVPVLEKLSVEELMETNTYQKFNQSIEKVFENTEDMDLSLDVADDDIPEETLISKYQLLDLCSEAAKLKSLGCMEAIPTDKLIRLLGILEKNIRHGIEVSPLAEENDDEYERKLWMEMAMERVMRAVDASLISLYILTSSSMSKQVYLEDVIDRVIIFTKFQLVNTIFPSYDVVYRIKQKKEHFIAPKKKRGNQKEVREKSLVLLYTKIVEVVSLLAELLNYTPLSDNSILHLSSMGVSPFFVEGISELQLNALKLVVTIFMKYEKHRKLILDDILASMARLPNTKQSLRSFRISSQESIQILTALVLQLMQCMVVLPLNVSNKKSWDPDNEITRKFKMAHATASNFLIVFLAKCSNKHEEADYRPIFENFIQDLLTTVNKPEWPVSELMLSVLGKLLVTNFVNKSVEMSLRIASLDYLGVVSARLRKDTVSSQSRLSTIDTIIGDIRAEELKDECSAKKIKRKMIIKDDEERIQFLQRVLLDYLAIRSQTDESLAHARHFYICQWYQDAINEANLEIANQAKNNPNPTATDATSTTTTTPAPPSTSTPTPASTFNPTPAPTPATTPTSTPTSTPVQTPSKKSKKKSKEAAADEEGEERKKKHHHHHHHSENKFEKRKQFYIGKINPLDTRNSDSSKTFHTDVQHTYIDYESAELVSRYLTSKRPFSKFFETFLKHIIKVLMESSVQIRTKAMKCLTMIVEADPAVLGLREMQMGVCHSFLDHSTSVREAAVDLVGKFVLSQPDLLDKYYDMLSERILDTGVSVRKRVIKILKDICIEQPTYHKIPEICVKMIRRVNDEDGIKKLVMEVFQNMWFTPIKEKDPELKETLQQKVIHITDVVATCREICLDWFEQLLVNMFRPKEDKEDSTKIVTEPPKPLVQASKQIVDCLMENIITLDGRGGNAPQRLVACVTTLFLFAKIRPQLLIDHAITIQPYLSLKCQSQGDYQIVSCVARILEIVVPLLEHASETFLSQLEEDTVKLIFQHDPTVIMSCLSCLGSVVNNVTRNYSLIRDCFQRYFKPLIRIKGMFQNDGCCPLFSSPTVRMDFRRSMYIVGLILRFFDFGSHEIRGNILSENICNEVFETLTYFLHMDDIESRLFALKSLGSMCIRHYNYMLGPELKAHYLSLLKSDITPVSLKVQVLNNIKTYLQEEEKRMIKQDEEWAVLCKKENLKEMNDVSSGMASTIIQQYMCDILESILHTSTAVRQAALGVIQLILTQGLVHPVQAVPYLACMSTDVDRTISTSADRQLQDIEKKYPGFIHMKAQMGIKLSFKLQKILQGDEVARGFRAKSGELPTALNGFLYSILRSKQQRRALVLSILKQFEEHVKTSLEQMLYLADNLAYFPYQVMDEPLFIIHHINVMISVTGTNLLQSFKEAFLPDPNKPPPPPPAPGQDPTYTYDYDDDDDEDEETLLPRIPEDTTTLQECLTASQGCLMLLVLKQHLKTLYGFTDSKIALYSPSELAKVYEKALTRKNNSRFHPKAAIQKLMSNKDESEPQIFDEEAKKELIAEYLEFKQLIISLDKDDDDDDPDNPCRSLPSLKINNICSNNPTIVIEGPGYNIKTRKHSNTDGSRKKQSAPNHLASRSGEGSSSHGTVAPLKIPKLTIVPPKPPPSARKRRNSHHNHRSRKNKKAERHKKHHHKRKKRSYNSDDSEDDSYSDPDFVI